MKKYIKIALTIIITDLLLLAFLFMSVPIIFLVHEMTYIRYAYPVERLSEFEEDYITIANFITENIEIANHSESICFILLEDGGIICGEEEMDISDEMKASIRKIRDEDYCKSVTAYKKILVFAGSYDNIVYLYNGLSPITYINDFGMRYKLVKIKDNWYTLADFPRMW